LKLSFSSQSGHEWLTIDSRLLVVPIAGDLYGVGLVSRQLARLRLFAYNLNTR
jgi:hypothetical protein